MKHYARATILAQAREKGVRICDDAKRACRNETFQGKLKCEDCLKKTRESEKASYAARKESGTCVTCGVEIDAPITGVQEKNIQKCARCYAAYREVETQRKVERNYKTEKLLNVDAHYRAYQASAARRNLEFTITKERFAELAERPCTYCGHHVDTEANGVDRIDATIGYIDDNVTPCCECCNTAKGTMSVAEFVAMIQAVHAHFVVTERHTIMSVPTITAAPSRGYRHGQIAAMYAKRELEKYIRLCMDDGRSPLYIARLEDAMGYIMTKEEFMKHLEVASREEVKGVAEESEKVVRIPRGRMMALLREGKAEEAAQVYEAVFGHAEGMREALVGLVARWQKQETTKNREEMNRIFLQYQPATIAPVAIPTTSFVPALIKPEKPALKQWKTKQIYDAIATNQENTYKAFCEANNEMQPSWEMDWITFVLSVKGKPFEETEKTIRAFVEELRRIRHLKVCAKARENVVDREDREQWPSEVIVRAFLEGKLETFKVHTEASTGDKPDDPKWITRWNEFMVSLEANRTDESKMKAICSKFMAAQRVKRYRRKKGSDTSSVTDSIPDAE
jgi:effector-binding domain-containing protein